MDSDRLKRIEELYHAAVEQAREKREAWLSKECGADVKLRREVESLVAQHEREDGLLRRPVWTAGAEMVSVAASAEDASITVTNIVTEKKKRLTSRLISNSPSKPNTDTR